MISEHDIDRLRELSERVAAQPDGEVTIGESWRVAAGLLDLRTRAAVETLANEALRTSAGVDGYPWHMIVFTIGVQLGAAAGREAPHV